MLRLRRRSPALPRLSRPSSSQPRSGNRLLLSCLAALLTFGAAPGCATHAKRLATPRTLFYEGRLEECKTNLIKLEAKRHDRDVVNLDLAMVELVGGAPKAAEERLKIARDRFDELEGPSIGEKTVSMWTDAQVTSYAGEDYEKILIRAFLAISNLLHDGTDAESYSLQLQAKHKEIAFAANSDGEIDLQSEKPLTYRPLPLGFYVRGMLREATLRDYDDAARNYEAAFQLLPHCPPLEWDIHRARTGTHSTPGHGVVYVFAMVGRGPYKIEVSEQPTSDALLIADRIVSAAGPYSLPPTIAPIKIPDIAVPTSDVDSVGVSIDGHTIGPTYSIADIEALAVETYQAKRTSMIAQAVARRVIKKATIAAAKKGMNADGLTSLGMDVAGIAWEATEAADTRCWGLLPRDIQVLRVEVPRGTANLQLTPLQFGRPVGAGKVTRVNVVDGRNTYVLCWFPDARSTSQIISSDQAGASSTLANRLMTTQR